MGMWKLRFTILGTLAVIISLSTLFFTVLLWWIGVDLLFLPLFVIIFNIVQWLIAPYLVDAVYHVREVSRSEEPALHDMVERLSNKSGIKKPRVMIAQIPIPNAFAYSSPIAGSRVAITSGLRDALDDEEVEAVVGHELGHLKHRDVQVMMFVSILPAIFYYIYLTTFYSSLMRSRDDRGSGAAVIIGIASLVMYLILFVFTMHLSRLREYFADRHSVSVVDDGGRKLSEGLAKIVNYMHKMKHSRRDVSSYSSFKALFISDPDRVEADSAAITRAVGYRIDDRRLVEEQLRRKITGWDRFAEFFSTHPNIVKRLRALQKAD